MKTFLQEIAQKLTQQHPKDMGDLTVVFPNRRAGLYFREALKECIEGPSWSPTIVSFQQFVAEQSDLIVADSLQLIHELYTVYKKIMKGTEGFDRFYFWGQMLLKDFDEVDKYLVDAQSLYTNLSRQKQLDLSFDFLEPEQKQLIQQFWQGFEDTKSANKDRFLKVWEKLGGVYVNLNSHLAEQNIAYEGMQYKQLAENLDKHEWRHLRGPVWFAGFNALTEAEERIISWLMLHKKAQIFWDVDEYYLSDKRQESGHFFRMYQRKTVFGKSFETGARSNLKSRKKDITLLGVPQHVGQAKLTGQLLNELLTKQSDIDLRKVAVVLADESLLFPVLHSLPEQVGAINVTMGFPLAFAPVNSLIESILELHQFAKVGDNGQTVFYFKPVLAVLRHPEIAAIDPSGIEKLIQSIEQNNRVFLYGDELALGSVLTVIFSPVQVSFVTYLKEVLANLYVENKNKEALDTEYLHYYYKLLNRYADILEESNETVDVSAFSRLFRQVVRTEKLPFTGEPLRGLQIMGVLETRNLDFEHVFVLSMNEDFFPSTGKQHSFIPYNLRRAYHMPHYDQQDAIYAYLFYRLLQRAASVNLFYNTEGNDLGGEEMSRFLQQLIHESGLEIKQKVLANYTTTEKRELMVIEKTDEVRKGLERFIVESELETKPLSPSAVNMYLDCRLRFYFRYIAQLYERDTIEEDIDARTLGQVLHNTMEYLYKHRTTIEKQDIKEFRGQLDPLILEAFKEFYGVPADKPFKLEGKNLIAREVVKEFTLKILKLDEQYAPFEVVGVEERYSMEIPLQEGLTVCMGGLVDRIDKKDGLVRLIDYKTGSDKQKFRNVEELFSRKERNKAALQTFAYTLMHKKQEGERVVPIVYNKNALFQNESSLFYHVEDKQQVKDVTLYLDEYREKLKEVLHEIFISDQPFDQAKEYKNCDTCPYRGICGGR
ncbi:MAG: PD-(D/E)XK nuclease family protein [Bacteroidota bacterium]